MSHISKDSIYTYIQCCQKA